MFPFGHLLDPIKLINYLVHSILCHGWGGVFFLAYLAVVTFSEAGRRKMSRWMRNTASMLHR
jgi:hypothetical protein